jgi:hypothetical protein
MTTAWHAKNISAPRGFVHTPNTQYPNRTIRLTFRFSGADSTITTYDLPSSMPDRDTIFSRLRDQLNGYNLYLSNLHTCLNQRGRLQSVRVPGVTDFFNVSFILENQEV